MPIAACSVLSLFYHRRMSTRCRLCTSNDQEALIDEMAASAWEMAGYGGKWTDVHPTWSVSFRHHAELMLRVLERDHDHG